MTKAFAYLRVSGKGQIEGDGFVRQLEAVKAYAAAHDIRIVRIFREEGVSGTKDLENRPALGDLMTALHANGIKLVLIEKLDRLARDLMVQETLLGELQKAGFELIAVEEPDLCKDDPTRVLLRQFMGALSQYEKTMIVRKLRGARIRMRKAVGRCEGAKPYGTLPGEAEVVGRMNELRASGKGFDAIAITLNGEGIPPRRGTQWFGSAVNKILSRH
jgi:DNA invertase Pin-like site-specific DNA recombinase